MTRKRFVKLCMALNFDRNYANDMAKETQRQHVSYERGGAAAGHVRVRIMLDNPGGRLVAIHGTLSNTVVVLQFD